MVQSYLSGRKAVGKESKMTSEDRRVLDGLEPSGSSPSLCERQDRQPGRTPRRPRPILTKSRSVGSPAVSPGAEKRCVSFKLPTEEDASAVSEGTSRGPASVLTQSLKRLTLAAASVATSRRREKSPPKKILRQPVVHVYLRGISGLPTQRVPLSSVAAYNNRFRVPPSSVAS